MSSPRVIPVPLRALTGTIRMAPRTDLADVVEQHWLVCWDRRELPALRHEVPPDLAVYLAVEPSGALLWGHIRNEPL